MLAFLSPAKKMYPVSGERGNPTVPAFLPLAEKLAENLKEYSPWQLESMLHTNPELALKAFLDYQQFRAHLPGWPALFSYRGLAYHAMEPENFSDTAVRFAQDHVRILSALYGCLRPLDGILPHRLELQCGVRIDGKTLYQFWGESVYRSLFSSSQPVVNLASNEYGKLVVPFLQPGDRLVTCVFLQPAKGKLVTKPTEAKMCRGRMIRFLCENRLERPEQLQEFEEKGYVFQRDLSTETCYRFVKQEL